MDCTFKLWAKTKTFPSLGCFCLVICRSNREVTKSVELSSFSKTTHLLSGEAGFWTHVTGNMHSPTLAFVSALYPSLLPSFSDPQSRSDANITNCLDSLITTGRRQSPLSRCNLYESDKTISNLMSREKCWDPSSTTFGGEDKWDENPQDPACGPHGDTWVSSLSRGHVSSSFTGEMSESCLIFVSSLAICLFETKAPLSQGEHSVALTAAQHCGGHGITKQRHCCSRTDSYQLEV